MSPRGPEQAATGAGRRANDSGLTVGLTGATGHIGGRLLQRLWDDPAVAEVRSVARRPVAVPAAGADGPKRFLHVQADLRSPAARQALSGADIVYHLGAQVWEGRGDQGMAAMHAANVEGAHNVAGADVGAVVLASSAVVYGSWPGNPLPMGEGHQPRPNPECPYAQHKLLSERVTAEVARSWAVARLSAVLGAHVDVRVAKSLAGLRWAVPAVVGVAQAVQWLDEEDAVSGLVAAGRALVEGQGGVDGEVFNLATDDWLSAHDVAALSGGRVLEVPRRLLLGASRVGRWSGLTPFGPDRAALVNGPLAISNAKAQAVLGWAPAQSSAQVMAQALARGWRSSPTNRRP